MQVSATLSPETAEEIEDVRQRLADESWRLGLPSNVKLTDALRMIVVGDWPYG